ncbi:MAG: hypothetical protein U0P30_12035 [Vicinamibacterales bacterium]
MLRASLLACVLVVAPAARPVVAQSPPRVLALVTTFADGRVTQQAVGENGLRAWTPFFPTVPGWREPEGTPPVTAFNVRAALDGEGLRVNVSVLRGAARDREDAIAEFHVPLDTSVTVDALTRVGLRPVTLGVTRYATPPLPAPDTASRSDDVLVERMEPLDDAVPSYRVTVRNVGATPLVAFTYDTATQGRASLTGQRGEASAHPLMRPGERYTFTLRVPGGRRDEQSYATGTALDALLVSAVLWADGRAEGDPNRITNMRALQRGRLVAVQEMVRVLHLPTADTDVDATLEALLAVIERLPGRIDAAAVADALRVLPDAAAAPGSWLRDTLAAGADQTRERLRADVVDARRAGSPPDARAIVDALRVECDAWLTRLQALFPSR